MDRQIQNIMQHFAQKMKKIFDGNLKSIIIYGSYARGDYNKQSDIDVMILVSLPDDEIRARMNEVSDCAFDFLISYGVDISPIVKNIEHFNYWVDNLPFYHNVMEEGVEVSV